jgi:hypothetical protein
LTYNLYTEESSMFVWDQCSWILWVTFTHECTSPKHASISYSNFINIIPTSLFTCYTLNYASKILLTQEHWPPCIKSDPTITTHFYNLHHLFPLHWTRHLCFLVLLDKLCKINFSNGETKTNQPSQRSCKIIMPFLCIMFIKMF